MLVISFNKKDKIMKKVLFLLLIPVFSLCAQVTTASLIPADSTNIKKMVEDQIIQAQLQNSKKEIGVINKKEMPSVDQGFQISNDYKLPTLMMLILTALYFFTKKQTSKIRKMNTLDPAPATLNIPIRKQDKQLELIRSNLKDNAVFLNLNDNEVSKAARELRIAKGELYLAAILKAKELNNIGVNTRIQRGMQ